MKFQVWVPVEIEIKDPVAALDAYVEHWDDENLDPNSISPTDLLLHANRLEDVEVHADGIHYPEWIYENGRPDEDVMFTRKELEEESNDGG